MGFKVDLIQFVFADTEHELFGVGHDPNGFAKLRRLAELHRIVCIMVDYAYGAVPHRLTDRSVDTGTGVALLYSDTRPRTLAELCEGKQFSVAEALHECEMGLPENVRIFAIFPQDPLSAVEYID